ncbi:FAD-dependent monooxygenase [Nakamurella sp.]|uniref:FAD-dependent monooxygenase n=1 Tax=Nakamurella sp. TaxID=1869182 RepID=UPI003783BD8B
MPEPIDGVAPTRGGPTSRRAIIVGGGIGGLTAALALRAAGIEAPVFERDPADSARVTAGTGITVWSNATRVLEELGLLDRVLAAGSPLESFENRTARGRVIARWPIGDMGRRIGAPSISIRRSELHRVLREKVGGELNFGSEYLGMEESEGAVTARFADGRRVSGDVLVGADGLRSRVRDAVLPSAEPRFAGYVVYRGIVSPGPPVPPHIFVQMWGRGARFGYYRVAPDQAYWFAVVNELGDGRTRSGVSKSALLDTFGRWAGPVAGLIEASAEDSIVRSSIYDRDPVRPWSAGRATLLGDAVHPMTFNVGQGACQAIEDAAVLARSLRSDADPVSALKQYEAQRHSRTSGLTMRARRIGNLGRIQAATACAVRDALLRPVLGGPARRQQELALAGGARLYDG